MPLDIHLRPGQKLYFASDFHLGHHNYGGASDRERLVIRWLETVRADAQAIFLVGDVFDFWFEYRKVIPKGFVRFLGKLADLKDAGIDLYAFAGNHDLWMRDYFPSELGIPVYHEPIQFSVVSQESSVDSPQSTTADDWRLTTPDSKRFFVGHGDGLGPGDFRYKRVLKPIFTNRLTQAAFRWLHPDVGVWLAHQWSNQSRIAKAGHDSKFEPFLGEDSEWLFQFCREVEAREHHDYYIFGHRHLPLDLPVSETSRYVNLGEWIRACTYAVFDGEDLRLEAFGGSTK
jgi:UDP-2,3-diacylglucosamine hydrolase